MRIQMRIQLAEGLRSDLKPVSFLSVFLISTVQLIISGGGGGGIFCTTIDLDKVVRDETLSGGIIHEQPYLALSWKCNRRCCRMLASAGIIYCR